MLAKNEGIKCLASRQTSLVSQGGLLLNRPKTMCMESNENGILFQKGGID